MVEAAARELVQERFLLKEDVEPIVELAARRWRLFFGIDRADAGCSEMSSVGVGFG